jgi:hypothetical protein
MKHTSIIGASSQFIKAAYLNGPMSEHNERIAN